MQIHPSRLILLTVATSLLALLGGCRGWGLVPLACDTNAHCPSSMICLFNECVEESDPGPSVVEPEVDGGLVDGNDGGRIDGGLPIDDAGDPDGGNILDAGVIDAGGGDAGNVLDAGDDDAGVDDAGVIDAGGLDAGNVLDAGGVDAGGVDAGLPDAGVVDAGLPDAGPPNEGPTDYLAAWPLDGSGDERTGSFDCTQIGDVDFAPSMDGQGMHTSNSGPLESGLQCPGVGTAMDGATATTISFWERRDDFFFTSSVASIGDVNISFIGNEAEISFGDGTEVRVPQLENLPSGQFRHWTVIFDGTLAPSLRVRVLVNGVPLPVNVVVGPTPESLTGLSGQTFEISGPAGAKFGGFLDEVRIYLRALSNDEALDLARAYDQPIPTDARLYAPFDGNSSDVVSPNFFEAGTEANGTDCAVVGCLGDGEVAVFPAQPWLSFTPRFSASLWSRMELNDVFFDIGAGSTPRLQLKIEGGAIFLIILDDYESPPIFVNGIADGNWHHIVVTFDGTADAANRVRFYVDSEEVENSDEFINEEISGLGSSEVFVGPSSGLDELMLFDRVVNATEIEQLYSARP